ncbi:hypothetical protein MKX01_039599 [Papaver californicum]|nr:hypothetical protein MKX01_039599 [Papaver californicum]
MGKRVIFYGLGGKLCLLLVLASTVLSFGLDEESISKENDLQIERKLKLLNKPALKTIQSEDGDVIDCVDIYKQPTLDHPALKHHKIQMKPSITYLKTESTDTRNNASRPVSQTWQKSGSCPEGTIPIRRIQKQDLLRAGSLDRFGMKSPYVFSNPSNTVYDFTPNKTHNFDNLNLTGASNSLFLNRSLGALVTLGYHYIGARGDINVWNPQVENPDDEYSSGQIWVFNGDHFAETAEAGWIVYPRVYGDTATRFFVYWTADNSDKTGCFDLSCQGFVQTSSEIALGAKLDPISSIDGQQSHIPLFMYRDKNTQNWWLEFNGKQVGYWPPELFGLLKESAIMVQWGGEVYSRTISHKEVTHTSTKMGSGIEALYHFSAWIRNTKIIDYSAVEKYPEWVHEYMDEPDCYSSFNWVEYVKDPILFFGGRGRSPICP